MAKISPFRAVRPAKQHVKNVASLPYDVMSSDEARVMAIGNEASFLHISKAEIDLPEGTPFHAPEVYEKAKSNLQAFLNRGILVQEERPIFYVYAQTMGKRTQYGLVVGVHVSDYEKERVKKHELTLAEKLADRTKHFDVLNAQTGPIFLTYRANPVVQTIIDGVVLNEPEYDFTTDDGIRHTVWTIPGTDQINVIVREFAQIPYLYIADGHHRAASATEVARRRRQANRHHTGEEEYNYILSVLFPHDQLRIMDYNRAVKDLNNLTVDEYLKAVGERFKIVPDFKERSPERLHEFGMYLDGKWYRLIAEEGADAKGDIVSALDVSILQNHLLHPILGIGDPRVDKRIKFIGGIRGMNELEKVVDSGGYAVAFSMYPPTLDQMMQVADAGAIMPPKSTWFEPKLRSGLFVHLF